MTRPYPFPESDAELWAYVRARVDARPQVSLTVIADDLDLHVNDLVSWIMAYSEPRRERAAIRKAGSLPAPIREYQSNSAKRFAAWRKQRAGAVEALRK